VSVSDEVINRLIKALGDIRTELKRIADYHDSVSVRAAESDQKVAEPETEIKYDQFARATSSVILRLAGATRRMSLAISALMLLASVAVVMVVLSPRFGAGSILVSACQRPSKE